MKVNMRYSDGANTNVHNSFYLSYTGTVNGTDLATLLNTIGIAWSANLAPISGTWLTLEEIDGTDLGSKTGAQNSHVVSINGTSNNTGKLGSGSALVISKREADQYRGGHARTYLPGMQDQMLSNSNTWTGASQTAAQNAWSTFINQVITTAVPVAMGVLKEVIVHRFGQTAGSPVLAADGTRKSVPLTNPVVHPVLGYGANPKMASQRRRNQQNS